MNLEKPIDQIDDLPDGVFVEFNGKPNLIFEEQLFEWSFGGYFNPQAKPSKTFIKLLTPPSTVRAIRNGFQLIIFNKNLMVLPREIGNLKKMTQLRLVGTSISVLPKEIGELKELRVLDLYDNQALTTLPKEIIELKKLMCSDGI